MWDGCEERVLNWSFSGAEDKRKDKGEQNRHRIKRKIGSTLKVLDFAEAKTTLVSMSEFFGLVLGTNETGDRMQIFIL